MKMGCTGREKHIRASRRSRSMKHTSTTTNVVDHSNKSDRNLTLEKSMLESGLKPWNYDMGINDSSVLKANNSSSSGAQNIGFDDCGWGYCTEEQLEEMLLKQLEFLYNEAVSKLAGLGYDEEVAMKAVLRNGHCYGSMDVLSNILHNSLTYLKSGRFVNDGGCEEDKGGFTDLRQLVEYSLVGMVCLLQQVRPHLSRGDAMWCLLMSDLHVGRASSIEIPMVPSSNDVFGNAMSDMGSVNANVCSSGMSVPMPLTMCKFHGGWGFGNGAHSELPVNGFGGFFSYAETSNQSEIDCAKRFNLTPSMKSLLKRNVAAFAAGFRSKQQMQMHSQACTSSAISGDSSKGVGSAVDVPSQPSVETSDSNQDTVNSLLNKFQGLNLDENLECVAEDKKDELILGLLRQIKEMERQLKEHKDWANQTAMQAARKLSRDLIELKTLRTEREEIQRLKKGKQTLEDTTMKRLSEMENALRKASSQVDRANAAVRKLEVENAEIKAEMEASKLSASESIKTCSEVAKREKKCAKKLMAWEKQKTKLQEEIAAEKQKIADLKQLLLQIRADEKETEAKLKREVKEKELAMTLVEEERRSKEAAESDNKRKLEALRLRIDMDSQRYKDDLQRLEQEYARLTASATLEPHDSLDAFAAGGPQAARNQGDLLARLPRDLDEPDKEEGSDRECLICTKEEVSVVFLPCAHQVVCASCGENYGKKGRTTCPCCRCHIEQKIRVFGASS